MKFPAHILRFRDSIAKEFGVPKHTVDIWAKDGLTILGEMRTSSDPVEQALYRAIATAFLPAYHAGVQAFLSRRASVKAKNLTKNKKNEKKI